ncbi:MAG TPA: hypothetical protein VLB09_05645 [Nitrospiria bacterium]|nr:hypothetical protein [Nitrospiria bacterium]
MAKGIVIEIKGMKNLMKELKKARRQAPKILGGALYRFAEEHIAGPAKEDYVPVVTSALKNSIHTQLPVILPGHASVVVGAGGPSAPYAVSVHENPRAGKTGGFSPSGKKYYPRRIKGSKSKGERSYSVVGEWKYLETPAMIAASNPESLIEDVRNQLRGLFRESG